MRKDPALESALPEADLRRLFGLCRYAAEMQGTVTAVYEVGCFFGAIFVSSSHVARVIYPAQPRLTARSSNNSRSSTPRSSVAAA